MAHLGPPLPEPTLTNHTLAQLAGVDGYGMTDTTAACPPGVSARPRRRSRSRSGGAGRTGDIRAALLGMGPPRTQGVICVDKDHSELPPHTQVGDGPAAQPLSSRQEQATGAPAATGSGRQASELSSGPVQHGTACDGVIQNLGEQGTEPRAGSANDRTCAGGGDATTPDEQDGNSEGRTSGVPTLLTSSSTPSVMLMAGAMGLR